MNLPSVRRKKTNLHISSMVESDRLDVLMNSPDMFFNDLLARIDVL